MKSEVQLAYPISVAFHSDRQFGNGANVKVLASFLVGERFNLDELQSRFVSELSRWDHKHLGLDVTEGRFDERTFARQIKSNLGSLRVRLEFGHGTVLEV